MVTRLIDICNAALRDGHDFPTIWRDILKSHPLVTGLPEQGLGEDGPELRIPLFTGQALRFGEDGFSPG